MPNSVTETIIMWINREIGFGGANIMLISSILVEGCIFFKITLKLLFYLGLTVLNQQLNFHISNIAENEIKEVIQRASLQHLNTI